MIMEDVMMMVEDVMHQPKAARRQSSLADTLQPRAARRQSLPEASLLSTKLVNGFLNLFND